VMRILRHSRIGRKVDKGHLRAPEGY